MTKFAKSFLMAAAVVAVGSLSVHAQDLEWEPASGPDADFFDAANWTPISVPGASSSVTIDRPNVRAVIDFSGTRTIDNFQIGTSGATGGNVLFSGGTLDVTITDGAKSHIGDQGTLDSTWRMTGDAVLNLDEPLSGMGLGSDGDGEDLEIGARTAGFPVPDRATAMATPKGTLIMEDNTVLRISDDLKIAAENNGNAEVILRDNAEVNVGSGTAVSEASGSFGYLEVGDDALLVIGNSAGAGNSAQGNSNEGYLTLSSNGGNAEMLVEDNGRVYVRTLQMRNLQTDLTIQDNGQLHVFDVFNFAEPDLGVATQTDEATGSYRGSQLSSSETGVMNLTLTDNAQFSVDSAPAVQSDNPSAAAQYQGLSVSGGDRFLRRTSSGGETNIDIMDSASFIIVQDLSMSPATNSFTNANSTLSVTGPDATVQIQRDLFMSAWDPNFVPGASVDPSNLTLGAGTSTLEAIITGAEHSVIEVGRDAFIENGNLVVMTDGYTAQLGDSYTLLTAGNSIVGEFAEVDLSGAELADGLAWDLTYGANSVVLAAVSTGSTVIPEPMTLMSVLAGFAAVGLRRRR